MGVVPECIVEAELCLVKRQLRHHGNYCLQISIQSDTIKNEGGKTMNTTYKEFDAAAYLDNDEVIAEYLSAAAEDPNPDVFVAALGDVAKARGMAQIAKDSGLGRESLYKALSAGAHPDRKRT